MLALRRKVGDWTNIRTADGKVLRIKASEVKGKGDKGSVTLIFDDDKKDFLIDRDRD